MRSFFRNGAVATALVLATLGATRADVKPVPGLIVAPCAAGFFHSSSSIAPYMCRTAPIKCPPHPNGTTAPLQTDATAEGHRFRYSCSYSSGTGLQCASGFFGIPVTGTQYECRTPLLKCPPRANVLSFMQAMPWWTSKKNGAITAEYRCRYH